MRGQVFKIGGKKIFTFGGARSHDISGGVLELDDPDFRAKKKRLDLGYEPYRINHLSWWEREMPSQEEMDEGRRNLEENDYTVDFIVSHCSASSTAALISHGKFKPDTLTMYLEEIRQKTNFKKWFFGHYHENRNVNANEILLYEQIIRIS
jgi:DNA repair exonuclease SbcCD nuclease subunit